ncbi:MAG: efflux RND transporter periplasmic adaptor subunit [Spirochaetota bacterium]
MKFYDVMAHHKKNIYIAILLCTTFSAIYGILVFFKNKTPIEETSPITIETYTVTPQTVTKKINLIGSIQYKDKAIISSKVFGRVEKIYVEQGNFVKKGQVLAKIETYPLELQLKEATAELEKAKANLRLAEEKLLQARRTVEQRLKTIAKSKLELIDKYVTLQNTEDILKKKEQLFKVGGITETELNSLRTNHHTVKTQFLQAKKDYETLTVGFRNSDIARAGYTVPKNENEKNTLLISINIAMEQAEYDAAKSHVKQVETQIEIIKTNIREASIISPINGIIAVRSIDIGEKVTEETNLFVIINTTQVYCIAQVNENDLLYIQKGQKASITIDALGNKQFPGKVDIVSPVIDQASRAADIKIICSNTRNELKPGMFARTSIFTKTIHNALCIPKTAIKESSTPKVFIIKNNIAFETPITIDQPIDEKMILIKEGLKPDDIIAISDIKILYDKAKVVITR